MSTCRFTIGQETLVLLAINTVTVAGGGFLTDSAAAQINQHKHPKSYSLIFSNQTQENHNK